MRIRGPRSTEPKPAADAGTAQPSSAKRARRTGDFDRKKMRDPNVTQAPKLPAAAPLTGTAIEETAPKAQLEAADDDVSVSAKAVDKERDAVVDEAKERRAQLRSDAKAALEEIRSHQNQPGFQVTVQGGEATLTRVDAKGALLERSEVKLSDFDITLTESARTEDGQWSTRTRTLALVDQKNVTREETSTYLQPPDQGRVQHDILELEESSTTVTRREITTVDENGRGIKDLHRESTVSFRERPASSMKLPGGAAKAFDLGAPVLERSSEITEKVRGERTRTLNAQTSFTQGHVRASMFREGNSPVVLLEKETVSGKEKLAQLFFHGTQTTEVTRTTVTGSGQVSEEKVLWDSQGKPIGNGDGQKKLHETKTTRRFDDAGRLAFSQEVSLDSKTGAISTQTFRAQREGDRVTETSTVEKQQGGKTETSTAVRTTAADGLESLDTSGAGRMLHLELKDDGVHYRTGDGVEGVLAPGDAPGETVLTVAGKTLVLPPDPKDAAKLLEKQLKLEERAGLDVALHEVSALGAKFSELKHSRGGVMVRAAVANTYDTIDRHNLLWDGFWFAVDEYSRLGTVWDRLESGSKAMPVVDDTGRAPSFAGQLSNSLNFLSIGLDAWDLSNKMKRHEYFKSATLAAKEAEKLAETGGRAIGRLQAASRWGRNLRAGRAAIDVLEGTYDAVKGDTKFDRLRGATRIGSGAVRVGLALSVGAGPLAPFLFGGLALTEALSFGLHVADARYVAPLAEGFAFQPKWAQDDAALPTLDAMLTDSRAKFPKPSEATKQPVTLEVKIDEQADHGDGSTLKWKAKLLEGDAAAKDERIKGWTVKAGNNQGLPRSQAAVNVLDHFGFPTVSLARAKATLQHLDGTWHEEELVASPHLSGYDGDLDFDPKNWSPEQRHMMVNYALLLQYVLGNVDVHLQQFKNVDSDHRGLIMTDLDSSFLAHGGDELHEFETQKVLGAVPIVQARAPSTLWESYLKEDVDLSFAPGTELARRVAATTEAEWRALLAPMGATAAQDGYESFDALVKEVMARATQLPQAWADFSGELKSRRGHAEGAAHFIERLELKAQNRVLHTGFIAKHRLKAQQSTAKKLDLKFVQPPRE